MTRNNVLFKKNKQTGPHPCPQNKDKSRTCFEISLAIAYVDPGCGEHTHPTNLSHQLHPVQHQGTGKIAPLKTSHTNT